jgi:signal transduction histidine kinase
MRRTKFFKSTSFRLITLYAVLFTLSATLLFSVIYWMTGRGLLEQLQGELVRGSASLVKIQQSEGTPGLIRAVMEHLFMSGAPPAYILVEDEGGHKLAGNLEPCPRTEGFTVASWPGPDSWTEDVEAQEWEEHPIIAFGRILPGGGYLLVGEDGHRLYETKEAIFQAVAWGMAVTLLLAAGGGVLLTSGFLHRIEAINSTTQSIVKGNLDERVATQGTDDELDQLAGNLNAMLDRIQILMESLRQVSSDIAHDLRLPLHHLRQRLESARLRADTVEECRAAMDLAIADTDAILGIFTAILGIAQIESGSRRAIFADVDFSEVVTTMAEAYEGVAEDQGQRLTLAAKSGLCIRGDRALLTQMLANLVENAIRHCPAGTAISLSLVRNAAETLLTVADTGPGISEEERPKVVRRFYRMDRSRATPGFGLGLSLVKAVVDLHGASLEISDNHPGLRVQVRFPDQGNILDREEGDPEIS